MQLKLKSFQVLNLYAAAKILLEHAKRFYWLLINLGDKAFLYVILIFF